VAIAASAGRMSSWPRSRRSERRVDPSQRSFVKEAGAAQADIQSLLAQRAVPRIGADLPSELLRATALGDQIAFAELYRFDEQQLFASASRMLRNLDAAK
jgi:hypothetical protein